MDEGKAEQIGVHKGALSVLINEKTEFVKLIGIVEQLMQMHVKALKDLGVDLEAEAKNAQEAMKKLPAAKKKADNLGGRL
ncbi:MAG: hypothetical protein ABIB71_00660 [Candidatus Woesearchaeota archaeon]